MPQQTPARVLLISMHTSPVDQPGSGDAGGMNVYVLHLARSLANQGWAVDMATLDRSPARPPGVTVTELSPGLRLLSVAVSPSRETLITLARLPEDARITVRTETTRFAEIITQHLSDLGHSGVQRALPGAEDEMTASTRCIVPPPAPGQPRLEDGNTIYFDYQIDRGSLLRVEEAVTSLLLAKGERVMGGL